ncbi:hypothetical protein MF573_22945 [Klebsiella pneumoniae]|nr:hypothetical protein MF573_22945 [Klebsiella pneumoniae]
MLTALNKIFAEQGVNIAAQYLQTSAADGLRRQLLILKPTKTLPKKALQAMKAIPGTIRARLLALIPLL